MADERMVTGIDGLDDVLGGGLPRERVYLVQGEPGTGKTTLALQFLVHGENIGERGLYVTLSETRAELEAVCRSHHWPCDNITFYEVSAADSVATRNEEENTLYVPGDVELGDRMQALLAEVERVKPTRVIVDSCSELRLLAQNPLRFRRQLLALKQDLVKRGCTVLLLENPIASGGDPLLQSLVHGVIVLEQLSPVYGAERRRMRVNKLREVAYRGGYHDITISASGLAVFPRLVAAEHRERFAPDPLSSGVKPIDAMLGGGLERGSSVLIMGPAGSGKSALASQYAVAAAERGEHAVLFSFDEGTGTLFARARGLGQPLDSAVERGLVRVQQVDPAELSPGGFTSVVRESVENYGARIVVIDSLNGYLHAMPEEQYLTAHLHELLSYLRQQGVLTLMISAQHGFIGQVRSAVDVSYLADTVVLTRYFEAGGRVRKAISVAKKRSGFHEDTIREYGLSARGLRVGEPLANFRGIMSGAPIYEERPGGGENVRT